MATVSYSYGAKFEEIGSIQAQLTVYTSPEAGYYSLYDSLGNQIFFQNDTEFDAILIDTSIQNVSIRYDFADNIGSVEFLGHFNGDILIGGWGDDILNGNAGDDSITGGSGGDALDGGEGVDTLSYANSSSGVSVNFATGIASGGDADGDIIRNFENLIGSGLDDTLVGDAGNNVIEGGGGSNVLDGGAGIDTVSYANAAEGVFVDLNGLLAVNAGGYGDSVVGFENVIGSRYADDLFGDDANNILVGNGGYDHITAGGGDDRVVISETSQVSGGAGSDTLVLLDGGATFRFATSEVSEIEQVMLRDGATADFSATDASVGLFRSGSVAGGGIDLTTTAFSDSIRLGQGADTLDAGGGDDRFYVYDGGSATIDGGAGLDRLYIQSGSYSFTDATLVNVEAVTVRAGASLDVSGVTSGMRIVSTSAAGQGLEIAGTSGNDVLRAGAGGDDLTGGAGDDRLIGGAGSDIFRFGAVEFGRDQVAADLGVDYIDLIGVANSLDDLNYRVSANGRDVVVTFDGLDAKTNAIFLKDVTIEDVRAAEDSFFLFFPN